MRYFIGFHLLSLVDVHFTAPPRRKPADAVTVRNYCVKAVDYIGRHDEDITGRCGIFDCRTSHNVVGVRLIIGPH